MPVTISDVLKHGAPTFPQPLVDAAKASYETKLLYTGRAVLIVQGIVANMDELTIDAAEAKQAIGGIIDLKADVNKRLDDAFAVVAADYSVPPPPPPPAPPPPPPPPINGDPATT